MRTTFLTQSIVGTAMAALPLAPAAVCLAAQPAPATAPIAARAEAVFPDQTVVALEVARTEPERARGLMYRTDLAEHAGMIFLFERPGIYPFWMKNTLIPLDMVWTDTAGKITWIAERVPPCKADPCPEYPPKAEASYVIELKDGFAARHKLKVGDVVTLNRLAR